MVVVERHDGLGRETTSRNSEVLHAGLYYPAGSWKAQLCVAGPRALYARCAREGIPHRQLGKLVVATSEAEVATLERLLALGSANGAPDLALVDGAEVARMRARPCARSPRCTRRATGIVDAARALPLVRRGAEAHGARCCSHAKSSRSSAARPGFRVSARRGGRARAASSAPRS